ncbi:ROK family protein [Paenibacillus lutrae]|uniref:ROK family protein n=1 Tax=Paenibacillus lutrae TaxID=2078573 RepID=A0A7X3FHW4_9BACL|nr:ROK family protein [Paenibacillus lutrae]MVO99897.1 ROK family protein [Paenibacillus lutrae]
MSSHAAIGIDIGGTHIKSGLIGPDGTVHATRKLETEASAGKTGLMAKLSELIQGYKHEADQLSLNIAGVGIGSAGYINREGSVAFATDNLPGWSGTTLRADIEELSGLPAAVDNDVNVIALGEQWLGAGRDWDSFLCVALGTGVGGCFIRQGLPLRGRDGFAGAYGHMVVAAGGQPCTCGHRGCWEQYASVTALKRLMREHGAESLTRATPPELFAQARAGDEASMAVVRQYAEYIAIGLSSLIHVFNPPAIVVGGAVTEQGDFLFDLIRRHVKDITMPAYTATPVPIIPAELGGSAGMFGAARLLFGQIAAVQK